MSTQPISATHSARWITVISAVVLLISFFLPWVSWDGTNMSGATMPAGSFFSVSETKFGLANPFPKLSFSFAIFWLIPALAVITIGSVFLKRRSAPFAFITGALSLALLAVFYLFSGVLTDLGVGKNVFGMLKPGAFVHGLAAITLILFAYPVKTVVPKIAWLLVGPVIAFASFKLGERYIMGQTHTATEQVKADYTIAANELLREFLANDTASNKKYLDKVIVVNGKTSQLEILPDSTSVIRFEDSTKSYIIFTLEKDQLEKMKTLKPGDDVSLKGVCSGSIFSEILGTTSISFKRATFNNK